MIRRRDPSRTLLARYDVPPWALRRWATRAVRQCAVHVVTLGVCHLLGASDAVVIALPTLAGAMAARRASLGLSSAALLLVTFPFLAGVGYPSVVYGLLPTLTLVAAGALCTVRPITGVLAGTLASHLPDVAGQPPGWDLPPTLGVLQIGMIALLAPLSDSVRVSRRDRTPTPEEIDATLAPPYAIGPHQAWCMLETLPERARAAFASLGARIYRLSVEAQRTDAALALLRAITPGAPLDDLEGRRDHLRDERERAVRSFHRACAAVHAD